MMLSVISYRLSVSFRLMVSSDETAQTTDN